MKLLLLGADGQVGWRLRHSLAALGEVTALSRSSQDLCGDLSRPEALAQTVRQLRPDVVVNAAAWTAVDQAESEPDAAFAVNATACEVLARETEALGAWLVHYSSDYVYDGSGERPWRETDPTGPLNTYGRSKLAGDLAIAAHSTRHLVFRTSWVCDSRGSNFLLSILKAAQARGSLSVVADQWGAPTPAALIADITALALQRLGSTPDPQTLAGVYHLAPEGFTNWHAYATLAVQEGLACGMALRTAPDKLLPIAAADYPVRAARPANSRLDTARLRQAFGVALPAWQDGVHALVAQIVAQAQSPHH
ncbi:dTDP-4-dehydrorhamnose reductase [uncultured Ramlibacter sp.]|uniref:dTDP-4-dehydrorhamnose reductase n=1 Tax=uncultured Ramlibacter sp. TaxID=260755 RepID=UPI0026315E66|nr:dTDP-4-dehydrorhamnose reductase [uncultured Ramlibacter sp.]